MATMGDGAGDGAGAELRALTVGDGNFSYSLALLKRARSDGLSLVASSFDGLEALAAKYPEAPRICSQLRENGARVLHQVDATSLRATLERSGLAANDQKFDRVVFNHPHCGEESVPRHRSLLSHFFASAMEVLAENGEIHLTLAEGQPERWEAVERAEMAGLRLSVRVEDVDAHPEFGLEYERKRHQNGKSFHQVTLHGEKKKQTSTLFVFSRAGEAEKAKSASDAKKNSSSPAFSESPSTLASNDTSSRKRKAEDKQQKKRQKQKQQQSDVPADLTCHECEKAFKSAQGFQTHMHMVHELQAVGQTIPSTALLPCGVCERTFKNEEAQRQHRLAKHGKDQLIQPDWFVKEQQPQSVDSAAPSTSTSVQVDKDTVQRSIDCKICRLEFATQDEFDRHWTNLKPKQAAELQCPNCERVFGEERALRQHRNFCDVTAAQQPAKASNPSTE